MQIEICMSKATNKTRMVEIAEPFMTGIVDPPWPYTEAPGRANKADKTGAGSLSGFIQSRDKSQVKYPVLSREDIAALPVGRLIGGYVFLWCVSPFLREGLNTLQAWGFDYITTLCWAKYNLDRVRQGEPQGGYGGVGFWFLGNHELVLVGKKPGLPSIRTGRSSLFLEKKTQHTAKPSNMHGLCEAIFPGPYVELFARKNDALNRNQWKMFGNGVTEGPEISDPTGPDIREELPQYLAQFYGK
jgi:N6-adenosine-specific RNA methylase IME4